MIAAACSVDSVLFLYPNYWQRAKRKSLEKTRLLWQGQKDLNPRHAVLETAALPTELYPYIWWAIRDSNPGPTGYEPVALTNWANGPYRDDLESIAKRVVKVKRFWKVSNRKYLSFFFIRDNMFDPAVSRLQKRFHKRWKTLILIKFFNWQPMHRCLCQYIQPYKFTYINEETSLA